MPEVNLCTAAGLSPAAASLSPLARCLMRHLFDIWASYTCVYVCVSASRRARQLFFPLHLRGNKGPPPRVSADFVTSRAFVVENFLGTVLVYLIYIRWHDSRKGHGEHGSVLSHFHVFFVQRV
jgi:hypothetical protein